MLLLKKKLQMKKNNDKLKEKTDLILLVQNVLNLEINLEHKLKVKINEDIISYWTIDKDNIQLNLNDIDIYKFMNKCKEWARKKGYILLSCPYEIYNQYSGNEDDFSYYSCYINISQHENGIDYEEVFEDKSEFDVIFKSCLYILKKEIYRDCMIYSLKKGNKNVK